MHLGTVSLIFAREETVDDVSSTPSLGDPRVNDHDRGTAMDVNGRVLLLRC